MSKKSKVGKPLYGMEPKTKISISIDTRKLEKIDTRAGMGHRSEFIESAVDLKLKNK